MMSDVDDLAVWLLERIAEDEAYAREESRDDPPWAWAVRLLAECEAKRRIIKECQAVLALSYWEYSDTSELAELTLRSLALPLVDRPGYRDEWRP